MVELTSPLIKIAYQAFLGCVNLEEVTNLEKTAYVGSEAFKNCESLTSIDIPEGVISYGDYTFLNSSINFEYLALISSI